MCFESLKNLNCHPWQKQTQFGSKVVNMWEIEISGPGGYLGQKINQSNLMSWCMQTQSVQFGAHSFPHGQDQRFGVSRTIFLAEAGKSGLGQASKKGVVLNCSLRSQKVHNHQIWRGFPLFWFGAPCRTCVQLIDVVIFGSATGQK